MKEIILVGLLIGLVLISGCVQEDSGGATDGAVELQYKGVWMPTLGASVIPESYLPENLLPEGYDISIMEPVFSDLDKAEQSGINTLAFQMSYWADEQGELTMPP